jgi:TPR repeat protein
MRIMKKLILVLVLLWPVGAVADFDSGREAYRRGDYATAMREWRPLAEQGHSLAQYFLGSMYEAGLGVPEDDGEAVKWFRRAAEQGHAEAQTHLGVRYDLGWGVPEDDAKAVKWWRLAAEQGDTSAQLSLGLMYIFGKGVPEDFVQAYAWFNLAAAQGDKNAAKNKGIARNRMTRAQIAEAQKLSRELCAKIPECVK